MNLFTTILAITFAFWLGNVIASPITENVANAEELEQRRGLLRNITKEVWQGYMANSENYSPSDRVITQIILNILPTLWTMGLKEEFSQGRELLSNNFGNLSKQNARGYLNDFAGSPVMRSPMIPCFVIRRSRLPVHCRVMTIKKTTGTFSGDTRSLTSFRAQQFYSSLVKGYAQSNGADLEAIEMFVKAIETAVELGMITKTNSTKLSYIRDYRIDTNQSNSFMDYRGCNYGALLWICADALEAIQAHYQTIYSKTIQQLNETITQHRKLADQITETCHFTVNQTPAKLLPARLYINEQNRGDNNPKDWLTNYRYDSGLEESYFVLWRATKEQKYRDYAWELTQAYKRSDKRDWRYELYSLGFKYLYLTFSDDTVMSLDQWVFTHKGHPLPICGRNGANPKC